MSEPDAGHDRHDIPAGGRPLCKGGGWENLKCVDAQLKQDVRGAFTALSSA